MSKQIKELFEYAFPSPLNDSALVKLSAEKFAELIVKQTMLVVAKNLAPNDYLTVAEAVIEHFGYE